MKTFTVTYNTATMTDVQYSFGANSLGEAIDKAPKLISGEITSVIADDKIDPDVVFEANQILTLAVAKSLIGKIVSVTNEEYKANKERVRTAKVLAIKSEWDIAGEEDYTEIDPKYTTRQEYWESYMNKKQIEFSKKTLILIGDSELNAACYAWNINSVEPPYFHGSDADRPIYYIVEDEN